MKNYKYRLTPLGKKVSFICLIFLLIIIVCNIVYFNKIDRTSRKINKAPEVNKIKYQDNKIENNRAIQLTDQNIKTFKTSAVLILNFDPDKADIRKSDYKSLNELIYFLKNAGNFNVNIKGYTADPPYERHTSFGINLSIMRAKAVEDYLVRCGLNQKRIKSMGFGPANPAASNSTDAGRAQNRRCEIYIVFNNK